MIFLIEYDKEQGRTVAIEGFSVAQREIAVEARLARELDLHRRRIDHEVVLLEADSEAALRVTHARYFESLREMLDRFDVGSRPLVVRERNDPED